MFLIKKGACTVVEDVALHLERELRHLPKSFAHAFVDAWKQTGDKSSTLFLSCYGSSACGILAGILVRLGDWKVSQSRAGNGYSNLCYMSHCPLYQEVSMQVYLLKSKYVRRRRSRKDF